MRTLALTLTLVCGAALADDLVSARELIDSVRSEVTEIDAGEARDRMGEALFIDIREDHEWEAGHIPDAVHYSRGLLEFRVGSELDDPDQPIVIYCSAGMRSVLAAKRLQDMGFTNVVSLHGGLRAWRNADLPITENGDTMDSPH
jgi:sulfur-carrier protein adenylyltransferase/sulfurtransferase